MYIILFGSPGVGKGTQAKILSDYLKIPHISTGDILRDAIKHKSDLGLKAKAIVESGKLVPNEIMIAIIRETFIQPELKNGVILDGFPRTIEQAIDLENLFNELKLNNIILINIEGKVDEIVKRLSLRRSCKKCGAILNLNEILEENKCPKCDAVDSLFQRKDDTEEVIKNRLEIFKQETYPVLSYFENKRKCIRINGLQSIDDVNKDIIDALELNKT